MPKRNELTLADRVRFLKASDGRSQISLATEFGIGKTQVQSILKRKAECI